MPDDEEPCFCKYEYQAQTTKGVIKGTVDIPKLTFGKGQSCDNKQLLKAAKQAIEDKLERKYPKVGLVRVTAISPDPETSGGSKCNFLTGKVIRKQNGEQEELLADLGDLLSSSPTREKDKLIDEVRELLRGRSKTE
jgi:hypothetical protein